MPGLVDTLFITGAGFSHHAGLPLTGQFTEAILEAREYHGGPSRAMVEFLGRFIREAFDHSPRASARYWPDLEDLFTCVDLSANTGHHLGHRFAPADLRTVRRALLARVVRMLDQKYRAGRTKKRIEWRRLDDFFAQIDLRAVGFVSMNWDTVIERKIELAQGHPTIDYCCDALAASIPDLPERENFPSERAFLRELGKGQPVTVAPLPVERRAAEACTPVVKVHGSSNWLYCDNCRRLFWFHPDQSSRISDQLISRDDVDRIRQFLSGRRSKAHEALDQMLRRPRVVCLCSREVPLATRMATFSYRKALDFPMFQKSWLAAEELLRSARRWAFIGYSLPPADFEFKYLLKSTQLSRATPPEILVVSGGSDGERLRTYANYQKFFGRSFKREDFFGSGLSREAVAAVTR